MNIGKTYYLVDVFTDTKFGGNPLAVFPAGHLIPENKMQSIAQELNLSETTFVIPPKDNEYDFQVRIFTPKAELPLAGHPTVGTAFILSIINQPKKQLRLKLGAGIVTVDIELIDDKPGKIIMSQPPAQFLEIYEDKNLIASAIGLDESDISEKLPCQSVTTGFPFLFVPLKSREASKKAKVNSSYLDKLNQETCNLPIYLFDLETSNDPFDVYGRMFAPHLGIAEDPATGGANGPLGAYLVQHNLIKEGKALSAQGYDMGRPSLMELEIYKGKNGIDKIKMGGSCVLMGKGELYL